MRALIFDGELNFVKDAPKPIPSEGESLIRVMMAGICNTDIEITKGYMNFSGILGHEFVGIVEKSGRSELLGKRVVGEINCPCGACYICRKGLRKHCPNRSVLGIQNRHGAFADYLILPDENLHVLPDEISDLWAVFTEPIASALEIMDSVHIKPTDKVLLIGDGKLGILIAQVLKNFGCDLTVLGKHRDKLKILENMGIKTSLSEDFSIFIPFDVVIEASGNPEGFDIALKALRPQGILVQKSTFAKKIEFDVSALAVNEIRIVGSRCGPFVPAINALKNGSIKVEPLISAIFDFDNALEAFKLARCKKSLKVILKF